MVVFEMVPVVVEPESRSSRAESSLLSAGSAARGSSTSAGSSWSSLSVDVQLKTRPVGPGTRGGASAGRGVCGVMFLTTSRDLGAHGWSAGKFVETPLVIAKVRGDCEPCCC
jgi:hypothetical protein